MKRTRVCTAVFKWLCFICLALILVVGMTEPRSVEADGEVIKVGYVQGESFITENNGEYSGYCVDYLEAIAEYTGWTYEYVKGSWDECLDRVESGEIDIVCMVQYTDSRADRFLYSSIAMGTEYGLIYARDDMDLYYRDYKNLDGLSIAMMPNTVYDVRLDDLEETQGIKLQRVYYDDVEQVMAALANEETDVAILGSIFGYSGAKVVGRDDGMLFYCVTGKNNTALMDEFNEALRQTNLNDPGIESRLYQRYYSEDKISSSPLFTREEVEYIKSADEIVVKLMASSRPLCYNENGELKGIFVEYMKLMSEKTGLKIRVEETTSTAINELTESQLTEDYLTLRSERVVDYFGLSEGLISSSPILETQLSYVKRADELHITGRDDYTFAISTEMDYYLPELLKKISSDCTIKYYNTAEECLNAVVDGQADIAVEDSYIISYLMEKPEYADKLAESPGVQITNGMCLISSQNDMTLLSIFNKVIAHISTQELEGIVAVELNNNAYDWTFGDFIYKYWRWLAFIGVILVIGVIIYTVLLRRMTRIQVERKDYVRLQNKVRQDELTGLYNKKYFYERAAQMIADSKDEMCIVLMDITNFKVVNDLFGLENGDKLLRYMAKDLKKATAGRYVAISRFNADHFYMCMKVKDFDELQLPRKFKNTPVEDMDVRVMYGVFVVGDQKDVPVNIMCDRASMALHGADTKSDEYIFYYTEDERKRMVKQQEIEGDMERALERREFCVYVQPKYDIYKRKIVGGEALARWIHPEKGMISPGDFIPVFEKNGFIRYLDYYIWEETCRLIAEIKEKGLGSYPVSINVSRAHFYNHELKHKLKELLEKYELEPADLELEITESIYVEDSELINRRIQELRDMGFKIAMDDFGSGYSSLNMLKEIPLDIIKMDLKFLDSSENVEKSHKILDSLVDLAKRLDLYVVVEGVETEEQVEFLQGIGEMSAQGYYFSRPIDTDKYEELLVLDKIS